MRTTLPARTASTRLRRPNDALLRELLELPQLDFMPLAELVAPAKADSLWQLLVLQGAAGAGARLELLHYAAPTYYGMAVATT